MFISPYTHSNKINSTGFRCLLLVLFLSITMGACRKEVTTERVTSYYGNSYSEIFEAFWNGMNTNYIFWDVENVNWDNMYKTYKSRFEFLDKEPNNSKTAEKAVQYLVDMTKDLADSHLQLTFNGIANFVIAGYPIQTDVFNPSSIRQQLRGDREPIPRKTFDLIIPKYYLTNAEHGTDGGSFHVNLGVIPRNNKNVLYLEYSSFQLQGQYYANNSTSKPVKPVLDNFFRYTKDPSIDGLIIDLRGNPGGSVTDLDFLLGRLITSPVHVAYTRTKNGSGRLDFTPWIKGSVHPQPGSIDFTNKPIAVLVDGYSASMSEMTSIAAKAIFSKSKLIGEKTWGGTGQIPFNDIKYMGGQFVAANFVHVYCAGVEFRDKNLISYENKGLTPDIVIPYDTTAIKNNIDLQLNKSIEYVISQ